MILKAKTMSLFIKSLDGNRKLRSTILSETKINNSFLPISDGIVDIGSSDLYFDKIYVNNIFDDSGLNISLSELSASSPLVFNSTSNLLSLNYSPQFQVSAGNLHLNSNQTFSNVLFTNVSSSNINSNNLSTSNLSFDNISNPIFKTGGNYGIKIDDITIDLNIDGKISQKGFKKVYPQPYFSGLSLRTHPISIDKLTDYISFIPGLSLEDALDSLGINSDLADFVDVIGLNVDSNQFEFKPATTITEPFKTKLKINLSNLPYDTGVVIFDDSEFVSMPPQTLKAHFPSNKLTIGNVYINSNTFGNGLFVNGLGNFTNIEVSNSSSLGNILGNNINLVNGPISCGNLYGHELRLSGSSTVASMNILNIETEQINVSGNITCNNLIANGDISCGNIRGHQLNLSGSSTTGAMNILEASIVGPLAVGGGVSTNNLMVNQITVGNIISSNISNTGLITTSNLYSANSTINSLRFNNIGNGLMWDAGDLKLRGGRGIDITVDGAEIDLVVQLNGRLQIGNDLINNSKNIGIAEATKIDLDVLKSFITLTTGVPARIEAYSGTRYLAQFTELNLANISLDYLVTNLSMKQRDSVLLGLSDEIVILAGVSATHTANIDVLKSIVDNDAGSGHVFATQSNKLIMNNALTIPINNLLSTNATISNLISENLLVYTSDSIDLISSSGNILNLFTTTHSSGTIDTNRINANTTNSTFINSQDILTVGLIGTNSAFTNVSANNLSSPIITEINGSVSSLLSSISDINATTNSLLATSSSLLSSISNINSTTNSLLATSSSLLSSISDINATTNSLLATSSSLLSSISNINATTNSLISTTSSLLSSISLIDTSIANLSFTTSNSFSNLLVSGTSNLSFNSNTIGSIFTTGGNVGIGTINPYGKLDLGTDIVNRKLLLYSGNNDHQYLGFGVNNNILRYQIGSLSDFHVFYAGIDSSSSLELMRINGDGNVSIRGDFKPRTVNHIGKTFEAESSYGNVYFSSDIDANNRPGNISYTTNYPFPYFSILKKGIWAITVNLQLNPNGSNRTVFMTKNTAYDLDFSSINQNNLLAWTSVNNSENWECQLNYTGVLNANDQIRIRVSGGILQANGNLHFTKICDL